MRRIWKATSLTGSWTKMASDLNPARVGVARALVGLTQEQLAAKSGVVQSHLSQIENGLRGLTVEVVERVGGAMELPIGFFEVWDDPTPASELMYRKLAGARVRATNAIAVQYSEAKRIAVALISRGGWRSTNLPMAEGFVGPDTIEGLAGDVRGCLGYGADEPIRHLTRGAERAGVAFVPLIAGPTSGWIGHDGVSSRWDRGGSAVIGYLPADAGDRQRFNNGHEIGHLTLHSRRQDVSDKDREKEAHRFAGALLLPKHVAQEHLSESLNVNGYLKVKAQFGISVQATIRRGYDLGLISQRRYKSLNVQISSKGWKRREPVAVDIEKPALLWTMLTKVFGDDPYSTAAAELRISERFLRNWIPERPRRSPGPARGRRHLSVVAPLSRAS